MADLQKRSSDENIISRASDDLFDDDYLDHPDDKSQKFAAEMTRQMGVTQSSKKSGPVSKKFQEDMLDDEDWMLSHGQTLKQQGLIQAEDPAKKLMIIKKHQEENRKAVEQSVKSASSYIDTVINKIQSKNSKSLDLKRELQTPSPTKKSNEVENDLKSPNIDQEARNERRKMAVEEKQKQLELQRDYQKQQEQEMTVKSASKDDQLDQAFYATGNALIATQAEKEKPEIFIEALEVNKQIMSKTTKANPYKQVQVEQTSYNLSHTNTVLTEQNLLNIQIGGVVQNGIPVSNIGSSHLNVGRAEQNSEFNSERQVGYRSEQSLASIQIDQANKAQPTETKSPEKAKQGRNGWTKVSQKSTQLTKIISDLFKAIANGESSIEKLRLEIASCREFDPRSLFDFIDEEKNRRITVPELQQFMFDNQIKGCSEVICQEIISEFDSDQDNALTYDEFLNIFLPAANESMRKYCLYNKKSRGRFTKSQLETEMLPKTVASLASAILNIEMEMALQRIQTRRSLMKVSGYEVQSAFNQVSKNKKIISLQDLTTFLEKNGFAPDTHDLEAILRRCDHDADRSISFDEFYELFYIDDQDDDFESPKKTNQFQTPKKETVEQLLDQQQQDAMLANFLRFSDIIQRKVSLIANFDLQKQLLCGYQDFNPIDSFKELDLDEKGFLQTSDFRHYFQDKYTNFEEIIKFLNVGECNTIEREDSRLTYVNFVKSLTPYRLESIATFDNSQSNINNSQKQQNANPLQQQLRQLSIKNQLLQVLKSVEKICSQNWSQNNTEFVDQMWEDIDQQKLGYVSVEDIRIWLKDRMGIQMQEPQTLFLFECFFFNCKDKSFQITKDKFRISMK